MPERSKGVDSSSTMFACLGSNPSACNFWNAKLWNYRNWLFQLRVGPTAVPVQLIQVLWRTVMKDFDAYLRQCEQKTKQFHWKCKGVFTAIIGQLEINIWKTGIGHKPDTIRAKCRARVAVVEVPWHRNEGVFCSLLRYTSYVSLAWSLSSTETRQLPRNSPKTYINFQ